MSGILMAAGIIVAVVTGGGYAWHLSRLNQGRRLPLFASRKAWEATGVTGTAPYACMAGIVVSAVLIGVSGVPFWLLLLILLAAVLIPLEIVLLLHNRRVQAQSST